MENSLTARVAYLCSILPELLERGMGIAASGVMNELQTIFDEINRSGVGSAELNGITIPDSFIREFLDHNCRWGNKVACIKEIRGWTGAGLKESKEFCEDRQREIERKFTQMKPPTLGDLFADMD